MAAVMGRYPPEILQTHSYQLNDFSTWETSFTEQTKVLPYPKTFTRSETNRLAYEEKVKRVPQKSCTMPSVMAAKEGSTAVESLG